MEPVIRADTPKETHVDKPRLRTERNRWFVAVLGLTMVVLVMLFFLFYAFEKAGNNKEIVYVKLEPAGGWSVVDYQPQDQQLFFKTTIDALLQRFAIARFGVNPPTIKTDWGEASVFMSPALAADFIDPQGFDALSKMKALEKSGNQAVIDIERGVEHYDEVMWSRSEQDQSVSIRSNVYLTRTLIKGGRKLVPEKLVLSVLWQLKDKAELAKDDLDALRLNPIGLTVLSYQLNKERT